MTINIKEEYKRLWLHHRETAATFDRKGMRHLGRQYYDMAKFYFQKMQEEEKGNEKGC